MILDGLACLAEHVSTCSFALLILETNAAVGVLQVSILIHYKPFNARIILQSTSTVVCHCCRRTHERNPSIDKPIDDLYVRAPPCQSESEDKFEYP